MLHHMSSSTLQIKLPPIIYTSTVGSQFRSNPISPTIYYFRNNQPLLPYYSAIIEQNIMLRILTRNIFNPFSKAHSKIIISNSNSIHFHLATEEYLFESTELDQPTLLIYRNSPTIVIGRHQNPWKQCRNQLMRDNGVTLSRRKTGGGAVYQDLGNTCFSFLTPYDQNQQYDYKTVNNKIIIQAFKNLGIAVEVAGRNDLHCQGRKMSGSAYRLYLGGHGGRGKKALHHGTILFDVDLNALQKYLNPNKKKLQSKGIDSVISRVMNLKQSYPQLTHQLFCSELQKQFIQHYGGTSVKEIINEEELLRQNSIISKNYQRLKSWDWLYGQCPEFKYTIDKKFAWGMTEVTYNVVDGLIKQAKVYSDCLFPDFITLVNEQIVKGVRYDREGLTTFSQLLTSKLQSQHHQMVNELCEWMRQQL